MDYFTVLAIESSCDETAVAILKAPRLAGKNEGASPEAPVLLTSIISTQIAIHRQHGGVVPELASRNHSADLPHVIRQACHEAKLSPNEVDVFAATSGPGLVAALLVGNSTGKALALATGKPYIAVNHLEGHLLSPFITHAEEPPPHLALVVSGGHTLFIVVKEFGNYDLIGRSQDDAAGEAFDKVGKMLGLPYPGGPEIDARAKSGNPTAFNFPRGLIKQDNLDVSFSGLKTSVLYTLPKITKTGNPAELSEQMLNDLCASFQQAVIDVLCSKAMRALKQTGHHTLALSGGVSCNSALRTQLQAYCDKNNIQLILPKSIHTTDNAAMIAYAAMLHARHGQYDSLNQDVNPNLRLTQNLNRSKIDRNY
ncbi:MAG: tRNA (adenosine(37)-N6)-threonylcarbamoyltransferase complex transferase subunit TsaD [Akkermansia sp.]